MRDLEREREDPDAESERDPEEESESDPESESESVSEPEDVDTLKEPGGSDKFLRQRVRARRGLPPPSLSWFRIRTWLSWCFLRTFFLFGFEQLVCRPSSGSSEESQVGKTVGMF